jgi:hypothetical protein
LPPETDNPQLDDLFEQDQKDRQNIYDTPKALDELRARDHARCKRVSIMIDLGEVQTKNDLYHAAIILHHSDRQEDFLVAHRFAVVAAIMGHKTARWLAAATLDRMLMGLGKPQLYGTQFEYNSSNHQFELKLPIPPPPILNFEKKFMGIPPIEERLEELNKHLRGKTSTRGDL